MERPESFAQRRDRENEVVLDAATLPMKRFFALDHDMYENGALPAKTKELLGLAASTVLRCNDCISYHVKEALEHGATREEITECLAVALVVGGSITIPHLRHAFAFLEELAAGEGGT